MVPGFDPQPVLTGRGLRLRPLSLDDREALFAAAADPLIWEQHPARDRHQRAVFGPYFDFLIRQGGALAVTEAASDHIIGTSSFYLTDEIPPALSVGFTFLVRTHWGGATNHGLKSLMLDHIFAVRDTAWLHIDPDNIRSQRATAKLGASHVDTRTLDAGAGPMVFQCWRLTRADWQARLESA